MTLTCSLKQSCTIYCIILQIKYVLTFYIQNNQRTLAASGKLTWRFSDVGGLMWEDCKCWQSGALWLVTTHAESQVIGWKTCPSKSLAVKFVWQMFGAKSPPSNRHRLVHGHGATWESLWPVSIYLFHIFSNNLLISHLFYLFSYFTNLSYLSMFWDSVTPPPIYYTSNLLLSDSV